MVANVLVYKTNAVTDHVGTCTCWKPLLNYYVSSDNTVSSNLNDEYAEMEMKVNT